MARTKKKSKLPVASVPDHHNMMDLETPPVAEHSESHSQFVRQRNESFGMESGMDFGQDEIDVEAIEEGWNSHIPHTAERSLTFLVAFEGSYYCFVPRPNENGDVVRDRNLRYETVTGLSESCKSGSYG